MAGLDSEVGELRAEVRHLRQQMDDVQGHVKQIRDMMAQARGARRALAVLAAAGTALISAGAWALQHIRG